MSPNMLLQVTVIWERFATNLTVKWFFPCVSASVSSKVTAPCKSLFAKVTPMRSEPTMTAATVTLEVAYVRKPASTQITFIWLLSSVCSTVAWQVTVLGKGFATNIADKWFDTRMDTLVWLQMAVLKESFATQVTVEWTVSGVWTQVGLQMTAVRELLLTKLTEEALIHLDIPGFWLAVRMQGGLLIVIVVAIVVISGGVGVGRGGGGGGGGSGGGSTCWRRMQHHSVLFQNIILFKLLTTFFTWKHRLTTDTTPSSSTYSSWAYITTSSSPCCCWRWWGRRWWCTTSRPGKTVGTVIVVSIIFTASCIMVCWEHIHGEIFCLLKKIKGEKKKKKKKKERFLAKNLLRTSSLVFMILIKYPMQFVDCNSWRTFKMKIVGGSSFQSPMHFVFWRIGCRCEKLYAFQATQEQFLPQLFVFSPSYKGNCFLIFSLLLYQQIQMQQFWNWRTKKFKCTLWIIVFLILEM